MLPDHVAQWALDSWCRSTGTPKQKRTLLLLCEKLHDLFASSTVSGAVVIHFEMYSFRSTRMRRFVRCLSLLGLQFDDGEGLLLACMSMYIDYVRKRIVLMPDKRARSWRGMWPGRDVAAYAKSVFSTQFSVTFTFLFSNIWDCFLRKKRELATQFSFLCMSSTVSGSSSWSFAIIGDHSLEVWQRALRMTGDTNTAKSSKLFFPSFLFSFACFLIFLKKAFSERKIALEKLPKKDEGTLQITVHDQSITNAPFETVGQVRKAIFACLTTD